MDRRTVTSCLVLMAGLTGTGKTELARALGRGLGWPVIDKDVFKSRLLDAGMPDKSAGGVSYDLALSMAEDLLVGLGISVIVDAPALLSGGDGPGGQDRHGPSARLKVIHCTLDLDTRRARLAGRKGLRSQPSAPHAHEGDGTGLFGHLPSDTLRVETDCPVASLLPEVLAYVCDVARSRR